MEGVGLPAGGPRQRPPRRWSGACHYQYLLLGIMDKPLLTIPYISVQSEMLQLALQNMLWFLENDAAGREMLEARRKRIGGAEGFPWAAAGIVNIIKVSR